MTLTLTADAGNGLSVNPVSIIASGLAPGAEVTLSAQLTDLAGVIWSSTAQFAADDNGQVDVATAPSMGGSYSGIDQAGLFWSLLPPSGTDPAFQINAKDRAHRLGQPLLNPYGGYPVTLRAESNGVSRETILKRTNMLPGIEVVDVRDGNLRGKLLRWTDRSKVKGAIMSLTGSGGGVEAGYAPVLASQGYDVFSLAYFAYEDLPSAIMRIPLEYFIEGFEWMRAHLNAKKIAVQGASRGGELSVILAAYLPEYVAGATPIVPMYASSCGWDPKIGVDGPSWTLNGKDIPFAKNQASPSTPEMQEIGRKEPNGFVMTPYYRNDMDRPEVRANAAAPIENASGPILLISGVEDQMWPGSWGSDMVINRLRAKGFKHPYRHLAMRETGHVTPLPNQVTGFNHALYHSLAEIFLASGGNAQGSAAASHEMWRAMLDHYAAVFAD